MDRTQDSGSCDAGSIPAEGTEVRQVIRPDAQSDDWAIPAEGTGD